MTTRLPAAVVATLLIQTIAALLWAGAATARISALEAHVVSQAEVAERLARLEEQTLATRAGVERLERRWER